jgi:hypothetical protein
MSSSATPPDAGNGYCRHCGKALTPETLREVQGAYYCPDCLAGLIQHGQPPAHPGKAALAGLIGVVPGLGAVYNGDFLKGAIHVVIFGLIISMISTGHALGLFIPMLVAWIFYMPFEAFQTAKARLQGTKPVGVIDFEGGRHQTAPVLLIVIGVLFLLNQFDIIDFDRVLNFWPVGLIGLGIWMLVKRSGPAPS